VNVAVDVVVLALPDGVFSVLLVKLRRPPFEGVWGLPGGIIGAGETVEVAAERELSEKTGLTSNEVHIEQLYTFSAPDRDPNGRCVSVAHLGLVCAPLAQLRATEKYAGVAWVPLSKLPRLAYDHKLIVSVAVERLRAKLQYSNVAYSLLPERFPLAALQGAYEAVLGKSLDTRNFRKRMIDLGVVVETREIERGKAHRPARLYRFASRRPTLVTP
jgi:8-oxo-dGTP diphosphatase